MNCSPFVPSFDPDAQPMPAAAEDVARLISDADDETRQLHDTLSDLLAVLDGKHDAVTDDPTGYTLHHVAAWRAVLAEVCVLNERAAALLIKARAA